MSAPPDEFTVQAGYPKGPRILAAAGAVATLAFFTILYPLALQRAGLPVSAVLLVLTSLPLVAFLGLLGGAPDLLQRMLSRHTALNLRDGGNVAAAVIMAGTLFIIIGFGSIVNGAAAIEMVAKEGRDALGEVSGEALFIGLIQSVAILTIPPFFYVAFVHGGGPRAALDRLGLRLEGSGRATLIGVFAAFVILLVIILVSYGLVAVDAGNTENERALAIAKSITVLGAVGLSLGAAVSEEVFFRGFLQPRIGIWGQTIVFTLAHLNYVSVSETVVVFVLALIFGLIYKRTGNLMAPIAAHFTFNLVMLVAGIYSPDPEPAAALWMLER